MVNTCMQKFQTGHLQIAYTQTRRCKMPHPSGSALFAMLSIFLVVVDNTKSDMNQNLRALKTLKGGLRADNAIIYNPYQNWN